MTDREPLTFTFESPEDEQVRASRQLSQRHWATRTMYAFFVLFGIFCVSMGVLEGMSRSQPTVALGVALSIFMLVFIWYSPQFAVRRMRKHMPASAGPHKWTLTPGEGVATESPGSTSSFAWHMIRRASESAEFYFLYLTPAVALPLPKRVVRDSDRALRELLRVELGPRAKLN